ncbi:MAG: tRNA (guanosine(46)-N7)-methyltransferase TrmB [Pseudarcicella sp.]|nr:tRNA (guanosine(46)-N7)-methyltransferase TrmB [Pseudarcicella sp.]MBP6411342.1 tRNA (guanosine(46)-N7)-methyltransferase TrmB [Pseudarcicella sp.]
MPRKKALRFENNMINEYIIQDTKPIYNEIKGKWLEKVFKNDHPIVLELGCGKGEYTVGLAKIFPNKNFIGIDIKGDRIAVGGQYAQTNNIKNVCFLRAKVHDLLNFFQENEVEEIWITFPDPHVLQSGIRRRMTNERFLEIYKYILKNNGILHLKTDAKPFFEYSLKTLNDFGVKSIAHTDDLYQSEMNEKHYGIKTRFEQIFTDKGFKINYLHCSFSE